MNIVLIVWNDNPLDHYENIDTLVGPFASSREAFHYRADHYPDATKFDFIYMTKPSI